MRCTECLMVAADEEKDRCAICGAALRYEAKDLLGKGGIVAEVRVPQVQMAEVVESALTTSSHAIAEAGVGTGKTFAYLIPAIIAKKRTVIATATVGLQSQIIAKDLPFLKERLAPFGLNFSYAIAKGRSHYVCGRAVARLVDGKVPFTKYFKEWAEDAQAGKNSGDKADFDEALPDEWSLVTAESCEVSCPSWNQCAFVKAKKAIADANVIVANHAVVGLDLALSNAKSKHPMLGPYDALVLDEAHKAADYIRDAFSFTATRNIPDRVARALDKQGIQYHEESKKEFQAALTLFFACLPVPKAGEGFARVQPNHTKDAAFVAAATKVGGTGAAFLAQITAITDRFRRRTASYGQEARESDWADYYVATKAKQRVADLLEAVAKTVENQNADNTVTFTRWENGELELMRAPISLGSILKTVLYDHVKSVVLTSATLTVGGKFDSVEEEFGIEAPKEFKLRVASPFDYDQAVGVYLPTHMPPAPKSSKDVNALLLWSAAVANEVADIAKETQGRCFVLFTARTDLEAVANQLRNKRLNVLKQDSTTTAAALAQKYRAEAAAGKQPILLGLKSFWEGVSIEGDDLSAVIITKLPFPPQTDPIYQARCERAGDESFRKVALPDMIKDLQQGTGRLIRTTTDVGIVAILDSRIADPRNRYRHLVLASLPFRKISPDLNRVKAFYQVLKLRRNERPAAA